MGASWMASQYGLSEWCYPVEIRAQPFQLRILVLAYAVQARAPGAGGRWKASGMRFWEFMCSDLVYDPRGLGTG